MDNLIYGSGGGGKGGGGSARIAVEHPNTLKSIQYAKIIDVLSEGEIKGLVNGANSIFLDDVPLTEFPEAVYEFRVGTQSQSPTSIALEGSKDTIEVGALVRNQSTDGSSGQVIRSIDATKFDSGLSSITVTIGLPILTHQDMSNGDIHGTDVRFQFAIAPAGGGYTVVRDETISGKCTSMYNASYSIEVGHYTRSQYPLSLKMIRVSADSQKSATQNKIYWASYTLNYPTKLNYPNTALATISIDSDHFTNIPTRSFEIYGIKVRIPTNYNPVTRSYAGSWDGSFKVDWTDNPAWIYYDLVTDTRYGIGEYITEDRIDKWELYTIARYCDAVDLNGNFVGVDNGYGGKEPRFTCNTYIQTQDEAYRILSDLCSIFRGMQYWAGGYFSVVADMPKDPVAEFTSANVIDGVFTYSGSSLRTRHTAVKVIWNDPTDSFKQKIEYVEANGFVYDENNPNYAFSPLNTYGVVQTDIAAIGCTSRGQANRVGKWLLYTELYETETVTFKTSIENAVLFPGNIIKTADPFRQGKRLGGRVLSMESTNSILLDSSVDTITDGAYTISFVINYTDPNTKLNKSSLMNYYGNISTTANNKKLFTLLSGEFKPVITENTIWVATLAGKLEPELWRVIAITQEDETTATITALEYHPGKFNSIENGLLLEERPTSQIDYGQPDTPETKSKQFDDSGNLINTNRYNVVDLDNTSTTTKLAQNISSTDTTIVCTSIEGFPSSGFIRIDNELIQYTGITSTSFTGVTRAVTGLITTPIEHAAGSTIRRVIKITSGTGWVQEYLFMQTPNTLGNAASLSWSANSLLYEIKYKRVLSTNTSWNVVQSNTPSVDLKPLETGLYDVEVIAINAIGRKSNPLRRTINILGKSVPPLNVSNFTCSKSNFGLVLSWNSNNDSALAYPDLDLAGYELREVYYTSLPSFLVDNNGTVIWAPDTTDNQKNTIWNSAVKATDGLISSTSYTDTSISADKFNIFLIKAKDDSGNYSYLPSISGVKINAPQIITNANISINGSDIVIGWAPPVSDVGISYYTVTYFNGSSNIVTTCNIPEFRQKLWFTGYETFDIRAYDIAGNSGPAKNLEITVGTLPAPGLANPVISGENYILNWSSPSTTDCAPIDFYEVRVDQNWGSTVGLIAKTTSNTFSAKVDWAGDRTIYLSTKDITGTYGSISSKTISSPTPGQVASFVPTVIDNNVLLSWSIPTSGVQLPIVEYEVRKGPNWDTASLIGTKTGLFTTNFETIAGTYTYWIAARNSANVLGTPRSVTAIVNQPPDYILATDYFSDFVTKWGPNGSITLSNAHIGIDSKLILPVNISQTWAQHFTSSGTDQISDFGNTAFIEPIPASGYYQEVVDLGANIAGSTVSIALGNQTISGSPNIVYEISASPDNIVYTEVSNDLINYFTQFRYVKVKIIVSGGAVKFSTLNVRIDVKQKTTSGSAQCLYSDSGGTLVYLTDTKIASGSKIFKDVISINLTPNIGCTNSAGVVVNTVTAIYDFTDTPDPLTFKILLFNSANGERLSGSCSYTIRGV